MISRPLQYVEAFAEAGSDVVIFHLEADDDPAAVIEAIRAAGKQAGLAINPETPAEAAHPFLDRIDMLLVMTVNPGWGGQPFMTEVLPEARRAAPGGGGARAGPADRRGRRREPGAPSVPRTRRAVTCWSPARRCMPASGDLRPVVDALRAAALAPDASMPIGG